MPSPEAMAEFTPVEPPRAQMDCESLTLYPQRGEALEWSGFSKDAPTVQLERSTAVQLRVEPGGAVAGTFAAKTEPLTVHRLETQGEWTRIAAVHFTGAVWHGWVPSAAVRERDRDAVFSDLMGGLGLRGTQGGWVACAVEQNLYAAIGATVHHVGRVTAATPFKPGAALGHHVAVSFRSNWLVPEEGVTFLMDAEAAACAPWIAPPPAPSAPGR
jgi:hypothetical protein